MSALKLATWVTRWLSGGHHVMKSPNALRIGLISTALINDCAIILPVESHPDAVITAVASRSEATAAEYATQHKIPKSYGSYDALLADKDIDAVYIGLPNSMHAEWAQKSLLAGKHVLLEKPFTANTAEARIIAELAKEKGLVLLEAFHYRFHPASHFVEEIVKSGKYGRVTGVRSRMALPKDGLSNNDIRFKFNLAGGSLMDFTYVISSARMFSGSQGAIAEVEKVNILRKSTMDDRVDIALEADFKLRTGQKGETINAHISTDLALAPLFGFIPRFWDAPCITIEMEHGSIYFDNFCVPHLMHSIVVKDKKTGKSKTHKVYKGGPRWGDRGEKWWTTYRYQLEAFVDKVRDREPVYWVSNEDSVEQMQSIDAIYEKSGLPLRAGSLA